MFFLLKSDQYFKFQFLCLIKPDSDRITTFEHFLSQKMGYYTVYVSHLGCLSPASILFETHINGFLEPESPNFDPNHAFLSSIEAEIITFQPKKAVIFSFFGFCGRPINISTLLPSQN